ncbi:MAG: hypothetical protein R3F40_10395 [Candidatus Competibacteraceae bacterium]
MNSCCTWGRVEPALPVEWLLPERVFQLAESRHKITRETALTLIRRHQEQLGDPARLAWLMESPHREVGLFTVRLLWERHAGSSRRLRRPSLNLALRLKNCVDFCARLCLACRPVGWNGANWTPNKRPNGRGRPASASVG